MQSAAAMDKDIAKRLLRQAGISVAPSVTVEKEDKIDASAILQTLGSPLFVKPCSQGSSFGVSKVSDVSMLRKALDEAFRYGDKALIEAFVEAREIECAVLEDQHRSGRLPRFLQLRCQIYRRGRRLGKDPSRSRTSRR